MTGITRFEAYSPLYTDAILALYMQFYNLWFMT